MKKCICFFLFLILLPFKIFALDICNTQRTYKSLAKSQCFKIPRKTVWSNFTLSAVKLTADLNTTNTKDSLILVPGGPGADSQSLALSLNQKSILDAFWAHLNLNVILFDPRGTGNSQLQQSAEYYEPKAFSTSEQVGDLKELVETVSPARPVYLFAHSAGGHTAAKFAALYPNKVKGLILYSASIDTREVGENNLRIFAKKTKHWKNFLIKCDLTQRKQLGSKKDKIETFLSGVLKLQRLQKNRPVELQNKFYFKDFRIDLSIAIENDQTCDGPVSKTLQEWLSRIEQLPDETKEVVEQSSKLKFDKKQHEPPVLKRGTWIRTAVICSEGFLESELSHELWLDGLTFRDDTCFGVDSKYNRIQSRDWLSNISAPTLVLGGSHDPLQLMSSVKRNANSISDSQLYIFDQAGHSAHLTHPLEFYEKLESFLNSISAPESGSKIF